MLPALRLTPRYGALRVQLICGKSGLTWHLHDLSPRVHALQLR